MRAKDSSLRCLPWGTGLATVGLGALVWGLAGGRLSPSGDAARVPRSVSPFLELPAGELARDGAAIPAPDSAPGAGPGATADATPTEAGTPGDAVPAVVPAASDPWGASVSLRPASFERAPRGESPAPR